ncbi:unnamed protein product [Heterotrigona itama]|uniref:Protein PET117 homolog, mitochondrial n=1 Tax=Heterotrigona itama TaxID=395501 RepID=A0A6V7HKL8_9HYME|nr:unnamed protein product [Heterotrigona itama]
MCVCIQRNSEKDMSLASKITFTLCCATSVGMIGYVHYTQEAERKQLEVGVQRDIERQERHKLLSTVLTQETQLKLTDKLLETS